MTRLPALALVFVTIASGPQTLRAQIDRDPKIDQAVARGLDYLAREQRKQGYWEANGGQYRVAMTALATTALLCEGSTTMRGKYAENIRSAVDFLLDCAQPNGLIGYKEDYRYTYGHGFSMLCLSQVFGEEEDADRRERIRKVLTKAVEFCAYAQTTQGGWGYVSAKDGNDFDEGSTCVTQVQGLRACRNAGIPVAKEIIDRAHKYIENCLTPDGGVQYSIKRAGGARPPITAAAVATLFSTGDYEGEIVKKMLDYCSKNVWPGGGRARFKLRPLALRALLLFAGDVPARGRGVEQIHQISRRADPPRPVGRRLLEGGERRPRLHDGDQFDDPPDRQGVSPDLSALSQQTARTRERRGRT
jgi:hypothetical protein